jgi:hypothetical protein
MIDLEPYRKAICVLYADNWAVAALALRYRVERKHMQECLERWGVIEPRPRILPVKSSPANAPTSPDDPAPEQPAGETVKLKRAPDRFGENTERNEQIMKLKAAGLSSGKILARLKGAYPALTRSAVIGVIHRHMPAEVRARDIEEGHHAVRMRARREAPPPLPPKLPRAQPQRLALESKRIEPREKLEPLEVVFTVPDEPQPEHVAGATLLERTGCAWPYGDARQDGITFCNAPRCSIKQGTHDSYLTPYCAEHWARRRASAYTKIVA